MRDRQLSWRQRGFTGEEPGDRGDAEELPPHRPVVVGVDGTPDSLRAVVVAARQAAARGTSLRIVHAYSWPDDDPPAELDGSRTQSRLREILAEAADQARATATGLVVSTLVADGQDSDVLLAESVSADLVVVGHRGLGDLAALLPGALGTHLAGRSACPLLIVGQPGDADGPVLVGIDDVSTSDDLLDAAIRQAHRDRRPLTVLHAWHFPGWPFGGAAAPYGYDLLQAAAAAALAAAVERRQPIHPDVEVSSDARCGRAADLLVESAKGASLLVVGSHGAGGLRGLVFGSVARAAAQHAPCPVLVFPSFRDGNDLAR